MGKFTRIRKLVVRPPQPPAPPPSGNGNRAPVWAGQFAASMQAGQQVGFASGATDPDGDAITYSARLLPSGMSASGSNLVGSSEGGPAYALRVADDGRDADAIVGIDVEDDATGTALLSFGQPFLNGDLAASQHAVLFVGGQQVAQQSHPLLRPFGTSGNQRARVFHALVPLTASQPAHVALRRSSTPAGGASKSWTNIAADVTVRVTILDPTTGAVVSTHDVTLASALAATTAGLATNPVNPEIEIREGPVCVEMLTASVPVSRASLRLQFYLLWVSNAQFAVAWTLTNGDEGEFNTAARVNVSAWVGVPTSAAATVQLADQRAHSKSPGLVFADADGRPYRFGLRLARFRHDGAYFAAALPGMQREFANYTLSERTSHYITSGDGNGGPYVTTHVPQGTTVTDLGVTRFNNWNRNMGTGGHQDYIGLWPRWGTMYAMHGDWSLIRAGYVAALNHGYQAVIRGAGRTTPFVPAPANDNMGAGNDTLTSGWLGSFWSQYDSRFVPTPSGYKPNSHYGDNFWLYVATGDMRLRMVLDHDANWNHFLFPTGSRGAWPGIVDGQGRGRGWEIRTLGNAYLSHLQDDAFGLWMAACLENSANVYDGLRPGRPHGVPVGASASNVVSVGGTSAMPLSVLNSSYFTQGWLYTALLDLPITPARREQITAVAHHFTQWLIEWTAEGRFQDMARGDYFYQTTQAPGSGPDESTLTGTWANAFSLYNTFYGISSVPPDNNIRTTFDGSTNFRFSDLLSTLWIAHLAGVPGAAAAIRRVHTSPQIQSFRTTLRLQSTFSAYGLGVTHGS